MKYIKYIITLTLIVSIFAFTGEDKDRKSDVLFDVLIQGLTRNHFSEVELNDEFSNKVYGLFIERMDYGKRFFLQEDIAELGYFQDKIDDELKYRTHIFLDRSVEILEMRIKEASELYEDLLLNPFDFSAKEDINTDPEKRDYAKDKSELKEIWRKMLKYQTLTRLNDMVEDQEKALEKSDTITVKSFEEMETKARDKVLKSNKDWFKRLDQLEYADRRSVYLNAITNSFDPHTTFFPPRDKENFEISMSGQFEGIGATLTSKDGYITVTQIVPGSASWRQGELEAEDKIVKVAQGEEEPVDVIDMRLDNAVKLIRGKKGTEVRLTVKKIDGSVTVIPIERDVVVLEETYAKSLILEDENKIGYIKLPKFYFDFDKEGGRNCFSDMESEIEKLKKENVNGIIVDLRNNGGGSLQDVVKIAGLFIEEGPVVQIKARNRAPYIFEDEDKRTQYDGPLVIMVNSFSASASEILAAALQDYERAIIVGSSSTYGKGTVQKVLNFDEVLPSSMDDLKPMGAVKVTMQKFYRINGGTTQLKGVTPDIVLPDTYSKIDIGEKELEYALKYDKIEALTYAKYSESWPSITSKLNKNSRKRIHTNDVFRLVDENAQRLKDRNDNNIQSLNFESFSNYISSIQEEGKEYREKIKQETGLNLKNLLVDQLELDTDSLKLEKSDTWHKSLKKDIYLFETVKIMNDLINTVE